MTANFDPSRLKSAETNPLTQRSNISHIRDMLDSENSPRSLVNFNALSYVSEKKIRRKVSNFSQPKFDCLLFAFRIRTDRKACLVINAAHAYLQSKNN